MRKRNAKIIFLFATLLVACGKPLPTLDGIDLNQWKEDRNGCNHFREKVIDKLTSQKDKLLGLSEDNIIALLGRPDQNELYKRNEKFFKYFLEPGPICINDSSAMILSIRFNSVGLAREAMIVAKEKITTQTKTVEPHKINWISLKDTTINKVRLRFTSLNKKKYDSLEKLIIATKIPLEKPDQYVTKLNDCQLIKLKNGNKDTLCNKKDESSSYFETYTIEGLWNKKNHLLVNFRDWEGGGDLLIDVNDGFKYLLNSSYELSPNGDYLLGYNKFDITPVTFNNFTLTRVVKDSIETFFDFDLGLVGIKDLSWKSNKECLIVAGTISYESSGIILKKVNFYLMTISF